MRCLHLRKIQDDDTEVDKYESCISTFFRRSHHTEDPKASKVDSSMPSSHKHRPSQREKDTLDKPHRPHDNCGSLVDDHKLCCAHSRIDREVAWYHKESVVEELSVHSYKPSRRIRPLDSCYRLLYGITLGRYGSHTSMVDRILEYRYARPRYLPQLVLIFSCSPCAQQLSSPLDSSDRHIHVGHN
jgi:hypothetical protein